MMHKSNVSEVRNKFGSAGPVLNQLATFNVDQDHSPLLNIPNYNAYSPVSLVVLVSCYL